MEGRKIRLIVGLEKLPDRGNPRAKNANPDSQMRSASLFLLVGIVGAQVDTGGADSSSTHLYYASRLIGALLAATVVPLLIDHRARRSSRARQ
jgi:hypothetical protein